MNLLLTVVLAIVTVVPTASAQSEEYSVDSLAWLAGCWQGGGGTREILEQWMKPSGKNMMGMSRTVKEGKVVDYEFLRIIEEGGAVHYVALPSGQKETAFRLVKWTAEEVLFENPDHDFPQRIIYRRLPDGAMVSRIEGVSKGKERAVDFPMRRVSCE